MEARRLESGDEKFAPGIVNTVQPVSERQGNEAFTAYVS